MEITIRVNEANQRFDRFLRKYFKTNKEVTLKDIYARIRKGAVKVNGKKAQQNYQLVMDDVVSFADNVDTTKEITHLDAPKAMRKHNLSLEDLKKQVLRENEERIFWNKPAGIVIHEGNFHTNDINLNDYLESYLKFQNKGTSKPDEINIRTKQIFKPAFAFRLDKDTSGVIVGAKTYEALKYLNKAIHDRQVDKMYTVIVSGRFPKHLICDEPLTQKLDQRFGRNKTVVDRKEGVEAKTEGRALEHRDHPELGEISLVKVKLYTGRMHQIRVHFADAGFPVLGDMLYGIEAVNRILFRKTKINRQLLHSTQYSFEDPTTHKQLSAQAPLPNDFAVLFGR